MLFNVNNLLLYISLRELPVTDKVLWGVMIFVTALLLTLVSRKMFQVYQLSSYRARGMMNWLRITRFDYQIRYFALAFLSAITAYVYIACFNFSSAAHYVGYIFFIAFCVLFIVFTRREKEKVPLKLTARMVRLHIVTFIVYAALGVCVWLLANVFDGMAYAPSYALLALLPLFIPWVVTLTHFMTLPFETLTYSIWDLSSFCIPRTSSA